MEVSVDIEALNQQIYQDSAFVDEIDQQSSKVIVGQKYMLQRLLLGLLADGHVLKMNSMSGKVLSFLTSF